MEIGRKVYYDKETGNVILVTGEMSGDVIETTTSQDFESYQALKERAPETVTWLKLGYGELSESFGQGIPSRVENGVLLFTYPAEPGEIVAPQPSLESRISDIEAVIDDILLGGA